jgi:hypothetical protein
MTDGVLAGFGIEGLRGARIVRSSAASGHGESGDQGDLDFPAAFHRIQTILFENGS